MLRSSIILIVTILISSAAFSQEGPSCSEIGTQGGWIGGSVLASDISGTTAPFQTASMVPLGGQAVVFFMLSEPTNVRVEVAPQDEGDTMLQLYDANGTLIIEDDDSGGNLASRAEAFLSAGQYCLTARSFNNRVLPVDMRVGLLDHPPLTAGLSEGSQIGDCEPETPAMDLAETSLDRRLSNGPITITFIPSEAPFHRFSLDERSAITLTATGTDTDPVLRVYDGNGALLEENDDFDGLNPRIDFSTPLMPGEYCIAVEDIGSAVNPVTLEVSRFDPLAARQSQIEKAEISPTPEDDIFIEDLGMISSLYYKDVPIDSTAVWYRFNVEKCPLIVIEALSQTDVDPILKIFDRVGRQIAEDDDTNGLSAQVADRLSPGEYLVAVLTFDGTPSGDIRLVLECFMPIE